MTLTLSVTAMISRSLCVIRTTAALRLQVAQDPEEMVGLLGREHARLVQDQDVGAAEEGLQDLDPLLHAHRKVGDTGVERHFQPVLALDLLDLAPGALDTSARSGRLGAEEKVLQTAPPA